MDATAATDPSYGYTAHLPGVSFDEARSRIVDALKKEGFGVLTEIDVRSTLKAKLGGTRNWAPAALQRLRVGRGRRQRRVGCSP